MESLLLPYLHIVVPAKAGGSAVYLLLHEIGGGP